MKFKKQNRTPKMEVDNNAVKAENGSKKKNLKRKSTEASRGDEVKPKMKTENGSKKNNRKRKSTEVSREDDVEPKMKKVKVIKPKMKTVQEVKPNLKKKDEVSTPVSNAKKRQKRKKKVSKAAVAQEKGDDKVPEGAKGGLSIDYLKLWKNDRPAWKFHSLRQLWLINNMLDETKVPDEIFPVFIEYMGGGALTHKRRVVKCATECLKSQEEGDESEEDVTDTKYTRARMILQSLDTEELDE